MHKVRQIILILLCCLMAEPTLAEDDVLSLLKELKAQVKELKSQVEQSNSRVTELEKERQQYRAEQQAFKASAVPAQANTTQAAGQAAPAKSNEKPVVTVGDVKGTFKIPGTDTSIGLGGYIKTDVLLNNVSAGRDKFGDQQLLLSQIPVGGAPGEHSQLTFHSKESRLWFKSFTPSAWGDVNTFLEIDFFDAPGTYTYTPRLRHAYGSIGNFLAGQTWTTFLNVAAIPDILDFGGSAGQVSNLRQPLVRWSQPISWAGTPMELQVALEAPRSRVWVDNRFDSSAAGSASFYPNSDSFFMTPNADRYPDMVARVNFNPAWGNISLSALTRQIRYTNSTTNTPATSITGYQQDAWGGAVSLAGKINTFGLDNIRFMAHYGNGQGRYVTTPNTFADAALDRNGNLDLVTTYGGMLAYQYWWSKQWRSNVAYGLSRADQPGYVNQLLNQQVQSIHANLLWSPISQAMLGLEYIYANRELISGQAGDLQRLQFSARYNF